MSLVIIQVANQKPKICGDGGGNEDNKEIKIMQL